MTSLIRRPTALACRLPSSVSSMRLSPLRRKSVRSMLPSDCPWRTKITRSGSFWRRASASRRSSSGERSR